MGDIPAGIFWVKYGNQKSGRENPSTNSSLVFASFSGFFQLSCFPVKTIYGYSADQDVISLPRFYP
jgi:hypothetical protein